MGGDEGVPGIVNGRTGAHPVIRAQGSIKITQDEELIGGAVGAGERASFALCSDEPKHGSASVRGEARLDRVSTIRLGRHIDAKDSGKDGGSMPEGEVHALH